MDHGRSYQKTNTDRVCRPESIEARELTISEEREQAKPAFWVTMRKFIHAIVGTAGFGMALLCTSGKQCWGDDQIVTLSPATQALGGHEDFSLRIDYSTMPEDRTLSGLGLRVHFDSSKLTYVDADTFPVGEINPNGQLQDDGTDDDGDPNTDKRLIFGWFDLFNRDWPGDSESFPLALVTANFTTAEDFSETTTVNVTASTTAANFDFVGNPATVQPFNPNGPPEAVIGPGQVALVGETVQLDGSGSSDPEGDALSYEWSVTSPEGSVSTLTGAMPSFTVNADGTHVVQLIVNDGQFDSAPATVGVLGADPALRVLELALPAQSEAEIIEGGTRAILFEALLSWSYRGEDAEWSGLSFNATGEGDESELLGVVSLYRDADGDGTFDVNNDELLGSTTVDSDNAEIFFDFASTLTLKALPPTTATVFLVAELVDPVAFNEKPLLLIGLAAALLGLIGVFSGRSGQRIGILLLLGLPVLGACGGGGGGGEGSPSPPPAVAPANQVQFSIQNAGQLNLRGKTTGIAATSNNLPASGPVLTI